MQPKLVKGWIFDGIIYGGILLSLLLSLVLVVNPAFNPAAIASTLLAKAFPNSGELDHVVTTGELLGIAITVLAVIVGLIALVLVLYWLGRSVARLVERLSLSWSRLFMLQSALLFVAFVALAVTSLQLAAVDSVLMTGGIATVVASLLLSLRVVRNF